MDINLRKLDLNEIRDKIDKIDEEIVKLIEERFIVVNDVAQFKKETGKKIFDEQREIEVINKNIARTKHEELKKYVEMIIKNIMYVSKEYQKYKIGISSLYKNDLNFSINSDNLVKIGYTGVAGSYAHEVLQNLLQNNDNIVKIVGSSDNIDQIGIPYNNHTELVEAVCKDEIEYAILPIENSIVGEVRDSIDLIKNKDVYIVGEVKHKIEHNLLGLKGATIDDITDVFSHEQALLQCSHFLNTHKDWNKNFKSNTAISAKYISDENKINYACIANKKTKDMYNLDILQENINDESENYTRFFIISSKNIILPNAQKISIITSTENKSGALMELLKVLTKYNLNMVNLKSRPITNKPWEYYFYIDFEGNLHDENVVNALNEIQEKSNYLKVLGNYSEYKLDL